MDPAKPWTGRTALELAAQSITAWVNANANTSMAQWVMKVRYWGKTPAAAGQGGC